MKSQFHYLYSAVNGTLGLNSTYRDIFWFSSHFVAGVSLGCVGEEGGGGGDVLIQQVHQVHHRYYNKSRTLKDLC